MAKLLTKRKFAMVGRTGQHQRVLMRAGLSLEFLRISQKLRYIEKLRFVGQLRQFRLGRHRLGGALLGRLTCGLDELAAIRSQLIIGSSAKRVIGRRAVVNLT